METIQAQNKQKEFDVLNRVYDQWVNKNFNISHYQNSMYMNWGYWNENTHNAKEACDNLVDTLMSFIQEKNGNILEVACGAGGVTRRLLNSYDPSDITAINISDIQLKLANQNAPGCNFMLMDATDLKFQDNTFDNMISVEAAFHFNTREKFFEEAHRVLKPGGKLVLSDILFLSSIVSKIMGKRQSKASTKHSHTTPQKKRSTYAGHLGDSYNNIEEYKKLYIDAGFKDVVVKDITKYTFRKYVAGMFKTIPKYSNGSPLKMLGSFLHCLFFFIYFEVRKPVDKYLMVCATK